MVGGSEVLTMFLDIECLSNNYIKFFLSFVSLTAKFGMVFHIKMIILLVEELSPLKSWWCSRGVTKLVVVGWWKSGKRELDWSFEKSFQILRV